MSLTEHLPAGAQAPAAVRIEHLSKTFPGQRALDDVAIEIRAGEIHALVGQNGSGKSTLIKVLSSFHKPDDGAQAWLGGEPAQLGALSEAERASMTFVHQDLALVPSLTVRENLHLERAGASRRRALAPLERRRERAEVRELLKTFDLEIDPEAIVGRLSPFERSAVAIVRALGAVDGAVRLLVLDEPTASLGATESERLFDTIRHVNRTRGVAILYVSHFLDEVLGIADRVTVLRDGRRVATVEREGLSEQRLIELIVGSEIGDVQPPPAPAEDAAALALLRVEGLALDGIGPASFAVRPGEVLGITGLLGSGYERLAECLAGARPWDAGHVVVGERRFARLDPSSAAAAGMAAMPADRRGLGLIGSFTIAENVTLPDVARDFRRGRIDRRAEDRDVRRWLDLTGVVPPDPDRRVDTLSGGNQQKVMLAKALRLDPQVLVLAEPTQAVDVGAAASIRRLIADLAASGRAVVVASADAEELEELCHRVLVMRDGRIACELQGDEIAEDRIVYECQFEGGAR